MGQRPFIAGPQLGQSVVQQPAAGRRAHFQRQQILGTEQHRGENTGQLRRRFLADTADVQLSGPAAGKQNGPDGLFPSLREQLRLQLRKLRPHTNELLLLTGSEGVAHGQIGDGLQQVGLSLGIVPDNQVDAGDKIGRQRFVVAKAPQPQLLKPHGQSPASGWDRRRPRRRDTASGPGGSPSLH